MLRLPTLRAYLTYNAHLFKAVFRQHHQELQSLLAPYIKQDAVVADVGAHAGQFTKLFARMAPQGRIYAFEPGAYALSILRKVARVKSLKNVMIVPYGLGDTAGHATLHLPIKKSGSLGFGTASLSDPKEGAATHADSVSITTLDAFVEQQKISKLDFIKCDIEGWEFNMLKGAKKTLETLSPVLMLELNQEALKKAGSSKQEIEDFLSTLGYGATAQAGADIIFVRRAS